MKNIYVAATSQHVGKTTTTLGLVSYLQNRGDSVGYCKPVGQKHVDVMGERVDKDTLLFSDLIGFNIEPSVHSPVIFWKGATKEFLEDPGKYDLKKYILDARSVLDERYDRIVYEGTGHPGVGSVAGLSNARVAKILDAGVIMIVEGGIGSTIDMLNLCLALFREEKVPVLGVIINKVKKERMDLIREFVGKWLKQHNLPLLGVIPYEKSLVFPLIHTIAKSINGKIEFFPEKVFNRVEGTIAGSLVDLHDLKDSKRLCLIVSTRGLTKALKKIESISLQEKMEESPLSGIVLTGDGNVSRDCKSYIRNHQIPLIRTELDTYGSVIKISNIEVKINRSTPWKVQRAIELFDENITINSF
jgi:dethiobiotin synthetase